MTTLEIRDLSPLAYALTRISAKLTGANVGAVFSPGEPIAPAIVETRPRRMQYPVSVNMAWQPRRDWPNLTPFATLRHLCAQHPLAALCIRVRSEEIALLAGNVVAKRKKDQAAVAGDCDALEAWFATPDRQTPRASWLQAFVRDLLEIDAPTIYKRRARGGGLYGLELIDGATIKPLLDLRGQVYGYQQVLYGLALSQYLGRSVGGDEEQVIDEFAADELHYTPYAAQISVPYGRAPMEDLISQAQIYLRKIERDLGYFTEGNIPAALGVFDGTTLSIDQVADFEANYNAQLAGDTARGVKLHFVPFPMKIERLSQLSEGGRYESAWEEHMVRLVCAYYGVTPSELGFTADVNRATADSQQDVQYRRGIGPLLRWLKQVVFDPVIQRDFGRRDLEWHWSYGESEDLERDAGVQQADIAAGVITASESRALRYADRLDGPAPGPPPASPEPIARALLLPPPAVPLAKARDDDDADAEPERSAFDGAARALFAGVLAAQAARILAQIRQSPQALDWAAEPALLLQAVLPWYDDAAAEMAQSAIGALRIGVDWDGVNLAALDLARREASRWAALATDTSRTQTARIIADWVQDGGTLDDLVARVERVWRGPRADVAAVTEVTRLYAQANRAAWAASGVVRALRWNTAEDQRVCPICGPRDGTELALDDDDDAALPPAHAMCRCWVTPVVREV